ncbi:MAG TPA: DUF305 domain-containing protein [Salinimicrobium sp.]|nr:DUF305 domain-containing protein [Salinimicrobium sp.]
MKKGNYKTFAFTLLTSFVVMFFVMYTMIVNLGHFYFSTSKFYMTFLMVAPMALIMLAFMTGMYKSKKKNALIVILCIVVFVGFFALLRNQTFVGDKAYMRGMIPHHSAAIMTSKNAELTDPEVRELAEEIIRSQREEIAEMKRILERKENEE